MKSINWKTILENNALIIVFVVAVVFSNFTFFDLKLGGVVLTLYRVCIPIICIYCIFVYGLHQSYIKKMHSFFTIRIYFLIMLLWIIWGCFSLFLMPWSNYTTGAKEIIGIMLGTMSVFITICLCLEDKFDALIIMLKICIVILILIGYAEILFGWHFQSSMINDPQYIKEVENYYEGQEVPASIYYIATGIFYNPNDFCAMLCIFSPVFLYRQDKSRLKALSSYLAIASIFLILLNDDAWICIISLIIGLLIYAFFSRANVITYMMLFFTYFIPRYFGKKIIDVINVLLYRCTGSEVFNHSICITNVENAISVQVENNANENGSMFYRLNTYREGLRATFVESKGLGLGPGGFPQYFGKIADTHHMIANPHSLWLEILSQYGVIVFMLFIIVLLLMVVKLIKFYKYTHDLRCILIISMGVTLAFACFSPSNFLQNTYYWLPIGMGLGILLLDNRKVTKKNESSISYLYK